MKIGFVVNEIETEQETYTTTRLAMTAVNRGHEVWHIGTSDFAFDPDEHIRARARSVPKEKYKTQKAFLADLLGEEARTSRITVDELDVLMLRNDPAEDQVKRNWAQQAGILFGHAAARRGVIVLNDPDGLNSAINKMYFQLFPKEVRPETLITRDRDEIRAFAKEHKYDIIIKPLQGSGGQGVFRVTGKDGNNLNQMIEAVSRDGYVVAQQYLTEADKGDMRLFVMNGEPLRYKGKYAAFRRLRAPDDIRSNMHVGGKKAPATVDDTCLRIVEMVRPKLVADGMFLVGLDIVGDKLMEINVFSPGGLGSAQSLEDVNFTIPILEAIEQKVHYREFYHGRFNNVSMATL
jgi:glutathione synthase